MPGRANGQRLAEEAPAAFGPSGKPIEFGQTCAPLKHGIPRKQLVSAEAAQGHLDPRASGGATHHKRVQSICAGVIHGRQAVWNLGQKVFRGETDFVVVCAKTFGHQSRPGTLVEFAFGKRDAESADRLGRDFRHQPHNGAGIDASRQKRPVRHVGTHAQRHRVPKAFRGCAGDAR